MKINSFKPKLFLYRHKPINDFFDFKVYVCNQTGVRLTVFGIGFEFYIQWYDPSKEMFKKGS